jgi:hypothetical protein
MVPLPLEMRLLPLLLHLLHLQTAATTRWCNTS